MDAKFVRVECEGRILQATIRGRLFDAMAAHEKRPVAVGDRVRLLVDGDQATVEEVLPRHSRLSRLAAGDERKEQVVVANVDQVFIVSALRRPAPYQPLIDKILAAAHHNEITPVLLFNKADLDKKDEFRRWHDLYNEIGYQVLALSATAAAGLEPVRELFRDRITALAGPSGAGKSSLLNAIQPGLELKVSGVGRKGVHSGRHTTTYAQLLKLDQGGFVVDTPGVRTFDLWGVYKDELQGLLPEFLPHLGRCAFANCTHIHEPDCPILAAVADGTIARSRHDSYKTILGDLPDREAAE